MYQLQSWSHLLELPFSGFGMPDTFPYLKEVPEAFVVSELQFQLPHFARSLNQKVLVSLGAVLTIRCDLMNRQLEKSFCKE
jgi:hypothetical protein